MPRVSSTPQSFLEYLKNLTADVQCVQGDFDEFSSPENLVGVLRSTNWPRPSALFMTLTALPMTLLTGPAAWRLPVGCVPRPPGVPHHAL